MTPTQAIETGATDLEKAQEVLRSWRRDAGEHADASLIWKLSGTWVVNLLWVSSSGLEQRDDYSPTSPLVAAELATKQTPWPQSVGER